MNHPAHEPSAPSVSLEQVLRIAELAQLGLTQDEQQEMLRDLNSVLGHVAQLNELDTTDVPAMAQGNQTQQAGGDDASRLKPGYGSELRTDAPRPSLDRQAALAQAPETDGTYFKVPRVIER